MSTIKKASMRMRAILYSFKYDIGEKCSFGKIVFWDTKKGSIKIGDRVKILRNTEICAHESRPIIIGDGTFINQQCVIRPNVTIGKNVSIAPRVMLLSDSHEIGKETKRAGKPIFNPIKVEDGSWIGANATLLGGVTIGEGCIIAAGAVVTKDCEPNGLYAGVPAKRIKDLPINTSIKEVI